MGQAGALNQKFNFLYQKVELELKDHNWHLHTQRGDVIDLGPMSKLEKGSLDDPRPPYCGNRYFQKDTMGKMYTILRELDLALPLL